MKSSLKAKLTAAFTVVIVLLGFGMVFGILKSNQFANEYELVIHVADKMVEDGLTIRGEAFLQQAQLRGYILTNDSSAKDKIANSRVEDTKALNEIDSLLA